jgi:hypothetical protein
MKKNIVIYTAVFGNSNYEAILSDFPGFDFICFTDKKKKKIKVEY